MHTVSPLAARSCGPLAVLSCVDVTQELKTKLDVDVRVLGIASSSRMLLSEDGIDLSSWKSNFEQCAYP